jgi:biotin operon repressor
VSQPNTSAQRAQDGACYHSQEEFDQGFHVVSRRHGITSDAKVVHAYLVSLYRGGHDATQQQMADEIGLTRHRVWSALRDLAEAGIIRVIRRGLGRPNSYILLAIPQEDLDRSGNRKQRSGQSGSRRPASPETSRARTYSPKEERQEGRGTGLERRGYADRRCRRCSGHGRHCDRCSACLPGPHADGACYRR